MEDFKQKRIDYYNNWPNGGKFSIEREYCNLVKQKRELGEFFIPYSLKVDNDEIFNKVLSFLIDALEEIETNPSRAFEYSFKGYDLLLKMHYGNNITQCIKMFVETDLTVILGANPKLKNAICETLDMIPLKSCQYSYMSINSNDFRIKNRVICTEGTNYSSENVNRKNAIDAITNHYGLCDYNHYENTIRKPSRLIQKYYLGKISEYDIDGIKYNISLKDKLHYVTSGFIYSLRNDSFHGSAMSNSKSSKANLAVFANNYYAFLFTYILIMILLLNKFGTSYGNDKFEKLADNIIHNLNVYKTIFGKNITL